uniref:Uncharacterized protein n=1 Tax=Anguilla anguilla TaxID=7936 RepID=A0A0E9ULG7_ANGAN
MVLLLQVSSTILQMWQTNSWHQQPSNRVNIFSEHVTLKLLT